MHTIMKKSYIIPQSQVVEVNCTFTLLQASDKHEEGSDGTQLVKEDYFRDRSRGWDDDWDDDWDD